MSAAMKARSNPFDGRYWGIWNVEGEGEPVALFMSNDAAIKELARRQALPEDDEDRLDEFDQVFPADIIGVWWNSYDPDPRADSPLSPDEVVHAYGGAT